MSTHHYDFLKKGCVFWYRIKGQVYGAIIIEIQKYSENDLLYLVLISERLERIPVHIDEVLKAKSYTLAWFDHYCLLHPLRIHVFEKIDIRNNFYNKFGLSIEPNGDFYCRNVGQMETWKHTFSSYSFLNESMNHILYFRLKQSGNE